MKLRDIIMREVDRLLYSRWCAAVVWGLYFFAVTMVLAAFFLN